MADLSAFATKKQSEEGVVLPVYVEGVRFPMAIQIFGQDADCVQNYEREKLRDLLKTQKKNKNSGIDENEIDELLDQQDEAVIIRMGNVYTYDWKKKKVVENEPVELYGKVIGNDYESKAYLINEMPALKKWVKENSDDRSNFLSAGKKN